MPSSEGQRVLALQLVEELKALVLKISKFAILPLLPRHYLLTLIMRFLPWLSFGHLDTSAEQTNDTKAQILPYKGGDLCLNKELEIFYVKVNS